MKNSYDILKEINEEAYICLRDTNDNIKRGILCHYVADEITFLFIDKNRSKTPSNFYKMRLESEAEDKCWNDNISEEDLNVLCEFENIDDASKSDIYNNIPKDLLFKERYKVVCGLPLRIFTGDLSSCPIANYHQTYAIESITHENDCIVINYNSNQCK